MLTNNSVERSAHRRTDTDRIYLRRLGLAEEEIKWNRTRSQGEFNFDLTIIGYRSTNLTFPNRLFLVRPDNELRASQMVCRGGSDLYRSFQGSNGEKADQEMGGGMFLGRGRMKVSLLLLLLPADFFECFLLFLLHALPAFCSQSPPGGVGGDHPSFRFSRPKLFRFGFAAAAAV